MLQVSGIGFLLAAGMFGAFFGKKACIVILIIASIIYFLFMFFIARKLRNK